VSEGPTHVAIARARAGAVRGTAAAQGTMPTPTPGPGIVRAVRAVLATIPDPELPVVSITDLGMVGDVRLEPSGAIRVELLPTWVGCPALDLVRDAVVDRTTAATDLPIEVTWVHRPPWTTARITAAGRAALTAAGIAVADDLAAIHCPFCGSDRVVMDSAFGPTRCRSLQYCRACRQPFEAIKPV